MEYLYSCELLIKYSNITNIKYSIIIANVQIYTSEHISEVSEGWQVNGDAYARKLAGIQGRRAPPEVISIYVLDYLNFVLWTVHRLPRANKGWASCPGKMKC